MNAEIVSQIAIIVIQIVGAVASTAATSILIPWLKQKQIYSKVQIYVKAAEKLGLTGAIAKADKKAYVTKALEACGVKVTPEVQAMIEAAVKEMDDVAGTVLVGVAEDAKTSE